METIAIEHPEPKKERPIFLTVLCILSFIGNGLYIMSALIGLLMTRFTHEMMAFAMNEASANEGADLTSIPFFDNFMALIDYIPMLYLVILVAAAFNLWGVLMMWKLKKAGFYLYAFTELAPIIFFAVIYTITLGGFGLAISLFNMIIPIGFTIMFGVNLKYLH